MSTSRTQTPKISDRTLDLARSLMEDKRLEYMHSERLVDLANEQLRIASLERDNALKAFNKAEERYLDLRDAKGGR